MKRNWVKGWNGGLTGPNTPALPTVDMSTAARLWQEDWDRQWKLIVPGKPYKLPEYPKAADYYIPIAVGSDTVAIAVGPDREEASTLIAKAPRMEDTLHALLAYLHPTIDREIIQRIKEVL